MKHFLTVFFILFCFSSSGQSKNSPLEEVKSCWDYKKFSKYYKKCDSSEEVEEHYVHSVEKKENYNLISFVKDIRISGFFGIELYGMLNRGIWNETYFSSNY